jgi:hypothetical protein
MEFTMNKIYLTLLMLILACMLAGQTGLFNISYYSSKQDAINNLEENGFQISQRNDTYISFTPEDNDLIDSIEVYFSDSDGSVDAWNVYYNYLEDDDTEDVVINALVSWHGEDYDYDSDNEEYTWELEGNHTVTAYWDTDYEYFCVIYGSGDPATSISDEDDDYWDY